MISYINSGNSSFQRSFLKSVLFLAALWLAIILSPSAYSQGLGADKSPEALALAAEQKSQAENLTIQLSQSIKAYHSGSPEEQAKLLVNLKNLADQRKQLLTELVDDDPAAVLKVALPAHLRSGMPTSVQSLLEEEVELNGSLEVLYEDYEDSARLTHTLESSGKQFSLHFAGNPPRLLTGTEIRAHGILLSSGDSDGATGGMMAIQSVDEGLQVQECCTASTTTTTSTLPVPNTFGEQRTLVLLVNFQNLQQAPWTVEEARSVFFDETSDFFLESSYEQTWLSGDVYGWYTLPMDAQCDRTQIAQLAEEAAKSNGIDISSYSRLVYMWPKMGCSWGGLSTVGGNPSRTYFNGALYLKIVGHEMGHSLGLFHSHGLNCSDGVLGLNCREHDYGDAMDDMGGRPAHFNAFQKEYLGWLGYGSSPLISTVTTGGTYKIVPYESVSSDVKSLKIPRGTDPDTGETTWFYLEYRQPIGFDGLIDDIFLDRSNVFGGVLVHHETEGNPTRSLLLDMTPNSFDGDDLSDLNDPALVPGSTYSDLESGIKLTTISSDGSGIVVNVGFNQALCVPANPLVAISPSESQWLSPGTTFSYQVTVTNGDSNTCPDGIFDLSGQVPAGWTVLLDSGSLTLAPGASGSAVLTVSSPTTAADGFYDVTLTASNRNNASYTGTAAATCVVSTSMLGSPPVAVDDQASTAAGTSVIISVLSNDYDPDADPITVKSANQGAKGTTVINADGTITYTPGKSFKSSDSFSYEISDNEATATAIVKISLDSSSGGGGKGSGKNR